MIKLQRKQLSNDLFGLSLVLIQDKVLIFLFFSMKETHYYSLLTLEMIHVFAILGTPNIII